ncbi:MAG: hypothetical protein NC489_28045 [Ruminococcus flavefaciens]|nr:hypothetical protein [Ruminococcus flavefaciens]
MTRAKKDRPKAGTFEQSCPGPAPRTSCMNIIAFPGRIASPNPDGEGGFFPHVLGTFTYDRRDRLSDRLAFPADRLD